MNNSMMNSYRQDILRIYQNVKIIPSDEKSFRKEFSYSLVGMKEILKSKIHDIGSDCIGFYEDYNLIKNWVEFNPLAKFSKLNNVIKVNEEHSSYRNEFLPESREAYVYYCF